MFLLILIFVFFLKIEYNFGSENVQDLAGTWTSKSNSVFTGPGFYDPHDELLIEPDLPGISYSFTKDGFYEEALYRITSNPQNHSCATASITFQHGKYNLLTNGSIILTPVKEDGRQLFSEPCGENKDKSLYIKYFQPTWFKSFEIFLSDYHGRYVLQLNRFDGSKMQPLYLAYSPPLMLPTVPFTKKFLKKNTPSLSEKTKRSFENLFKTNAIKNNKKTQSDTLWFGSAFALLISSFFIFVH